MASHIYKLHRKHIKKKHAKWHMENTKILDDIGMEYHKATHECYCFRGVVNADFYPSTGRWVDIDNRCTRNGGAKLFLDWYNSKYYKACGGPHCGN